MKMWLRVDNIYGGLSPAKTVARDDQYMAGVGFDPDAPITDSDTKPGGVLRPMGYTERSGSVLDQVVGWIVAAITGVVYAYCKGGDLISYATAFTSETLARAVGSSSGNGLAMYNNYLYYGLNANVGRYGPLDGSPSFDDSFWSSISIGNLTSVTLATPRLNALDGFRYPSMKMHVHIDGKLYFPDYKDGKGYVHFIKTTKGTAIGDTNDGSTFQALDLPFGYRIYDIQSFGLSLAILASSGDDENTRKGNTKLFIWDTVSDSFSAAIDVPDPIGTALLYANGVLYGWSGSMNGGVRFWRYIGGDSIETIEYINDSYSPPSGAVQADGQRVIWGGYITFPTNAAVVFAWGTKSGKIRSGVHVIARSNLAATSSDGGVTAIGLTEPSSKSYPPISFAATTGVSSAAGVSIETKGTTYQSATFRSRQFNIGRPYTVTKILLPLGQLMAANMTISPAIIIDNTSIPGGTTINNTNYPNSDKIIKMSEGNFDGATSGKHSLVLSLDISGTALCTILLPILIEIDVPDIV